MDELKNKVFLFIDSIDFIPNNYEMEINPYYEKIELVINKRIQDNQNIFGVEINFYSNQTIDLIVIDWEGDIIDNKIVSGEANHSFPLIKQYLKDILYSSQ